MKRSLVLAGGGVRLAYHAGVLMALEEAGLQFNHVDGTSGGIFGAAMIGSGVSPKAAAARWRNLKLRGFMSMLPLKDYRSQHSLPAMGGAKGIREKVFPTLGIDVDSIRQNAAIDLTFNVCNFSRKTIESIEGPRVTLDHLIAGMSLPIFSPAVKINGDWYTDGIWIKDANLTEAVKRGADDIWLVWCIGNGREYLNGIFNQYVHMIEISANGGVFAEMDWIQEENVRRLQLGRQPVQLHIIKPDYPLPLDPDFFLGKVNADTLINMGYADTKNYLKEKIPFDFMDIPASTAMNEPGITLHFRQQFKGDIDINEVPHTLIIYLSFFLRKIGDTQEIRLFSSVETETGEVVSGYNNRTVLTGKGIVENTFRCNFPEGVSEIRLLMQFHSLLGFLLALDIKTAGVAITTDGNISTERTFVQAASNRIRNRWHLNVNGNIGLFAKWKFMRDMLCVLAP